MNNKALRLAQTKFSLNIKLVTSNNLDYNSDITDNDEFNGVGFTSGIRISW